MDEGLDKEIYGKVKKMKVGKTSKMCTICCVAFQKGKILVSLQSFLWNKGTLMWKGYYCERGKLFPRPK
jgi:hypothetical protein